MKEEGRKPIALRAIQGHTHRVTADTPYDDRFEEENANGELRKTQVLHSSKGGQILYLVHTNKKGLGKTTPEKHP